MCNFFFSSSHERKKKYWEQLELRCRHLYRRPPPPHGLGNHGNHINSSMLVTPGSQCGYCTTTTGIEFLKNLTFAKNILCGFRWKIYINLMQGIHMNKMQSHKHPFILRPPFLQFLEIRFEKSGSRNLVRE